MIESIAFTLLMKKLQIICIASALVVASGLSIYNLPWEAEEWGNLKRSIKRFFSVRIRIQFLRGDVQRITEEEQNFTVIQS